MMIYVVQQNSIFNFQPSIINLLSDVWQKIGDDAEQGQECRQLEYILDAGNVGKPPEYCRTDAAQSE